MFKLREVRIYDSPTAILHEILEFIVMPRSLNYVFLSVLQRDIEIFLSPKLTTKRMLENVQNESPKY